MHLQKIPTIFVKDGIERKAFFTVEARELVADGWVEKGDEKPQPKATAKPSAKTVEEKPKTEKVKAEEEGLAK